MGLGRRLLRCDLLHTSITQDELELTRQALEKERLLSPGSTSRAERGPREEVGAQLKEVSWGPGGNRWPGGSSFPGACSPPLEIGSLKLRPATLVCLPSVCSPIGLRGWPGESPRAVPQVPGGEAEPGLGTEEKQLWGQRLEHLQRAVAQLEIDRSRLQHHNVQLRAALEQVSPFSCPQCPYLGLSTRVSSLLMEPPEQSSQIRGHIQPAASC